MKSIILEGKNKNRKGFSFVEILIAIFIFCLVMTSVITIFLKIVDAQKRAVSMQRNLESAKFALEEMSKIIKASQIISCNKNPSSSCSTPINSIEMFNYSQKRCIQYKKSTESGSGKAIFETASYPKDSPGECIDSFTDHANIIGNTTVNNSFLEKINFNVTNEIKPGRVTVSMEVCSDYRGRGCTSGKSNKFFIQTTASLRN